MTEATQGPGGQSANETAVALIDVLMRNLAVARDNLEKPGEGEVQGLFCGLAYGGGGAICPLLYYHSLTDEPSKIAPE